MKPVSVIRLINDLPSDYVLESAFLLELIADIGALLAYPTDSIKIRSDCQSMIQLVTSHAKQSTLTSHAQLSLIRLAYQLIMRQSVDLQWTPSQVIRNDKRSYLPSLTLTGVSLLLTGTRILRAPLFHLVQTVHVSMLLSFR